MATTTRKLADLAQFVANDSTIGTGGIVALDTGDITTGTFDVLRISAASVSQHVATPDTSIIVGKTAQALTGTIATSTAYYGVNFTCTGNLTINDTLLIGRMLKDQSAVSLTHTAATAVTITGTGSLVFGTGILIQPTA
jgi:hypothetical protein